MCYLDDTDIVGLKSVTSMILVERRDCVVSMTV